MPAIFPKKKSSILECRQMVFEGGILECLPIFLPEAFYVSVRNSKNEIRSLFLCALSLSLSLYLCVSIYTNTLNV